MKEKYKKYLEEFVNPHPQFGDVLTKERTKEDLKEGLEGLEKWFEAIILECDKVLEKEKGINSKQLFEKAIKEKNVMERYLKYTDHLGEILPTRPNILNGNTFEERVDAYEALVAHVKSTWIKSKTFYEDGDYPLSVFLSILTIEETAKLNFAWMDIFRKDADNNIKPSKFFANHKSKLFIGVMSGCLVNARMDRILGIDFINKMIELAESNQLMNLRNSSLYIDYKDGEIFLPNQVIDKELSEKLCVLSGEIMAEVVGFFPWDWDDLLNEVKAFENQIGLDIEGTQNS